MPNLNKLFIYIPTYNRPNLLRRQLQVLLPQVGRYTENVRVLICDNASEKYEVDEILQDFPTFPNVQVRRNGGNVGGNANIALGFAFAQSNEFLWILSDNDIVSHDAIQYVISMLDTEIDFFCFTDDADSVSDVEHLWESGWQTPMDWRMGLISAALYNMATVSNSIEDAFFFHNSSFPHLAVACSAAKKKKATKFRLLPMKKILSNIMPSSEQSGDYSLSQVCMPLLVPLFPAWEAKAFCRKWLWRHGLNLHRNKSKYPHLYIQSKETLVSYGGWRALFLMRLMGISRIAIDPYLNKRKAIVQLLEKRLSASNLQRIKRLRKYLTRKT
jgi:glycosyltransferase involved in cell wall biosynthesis